MKEHFFNNLLGSTALDISRLPVSQYPLHRGIIIHRIGQLPVGTISLVVGVAAPHREEAFLKQRVPIWKQAS